MDKGRAIGSNRVRVDISAPILSWALERSGNSSMVKRRFPKISEWLSGESMPTLRQLEKLANATATPLGYFFLAEPPRVELPIPFFRTINREPARWYSPELIDSVQTMKRRQAWMREYLIEQRRAPLPFVSSATIGGEPRRIAREIQRTLSLGDGWAVALPAWSAALRELRERMESAGIIVVVNGIVGNNTRRKLDPDEFRGFVLVDEYAPLVLVNGADGKAAQMFTLAHELAHVWFGASAAFDLRELQPADVAIEQA